VWSASPRIFLTSAALQLLTGATIAVQLLLARAVLGTLVPGRGGEVQFARAVPYIIVLAIVFALSNFAMSIQYELQRLLSELVNRRTAASVLDIAITAPLEAFESSEFHDRLQRAEMGAGMRPFQITQSILGMIGGAAGVIGVSVALFVLQPILVVLILIAFLPIWFTAVRGSRAFYRFSFGMTANDRRRAYLRNTLTNRDAAKEVIAFGLGSLFHDMWTRLYADRIAELRKLVVDRVKLALASSAITSLVVLGPVALVTYLVAIGLMSVPQALAGVIGLILLRPALAGIIFSAVQLYESSLFLEDYAVFLRLKPRVEPKPVVAPMPAPFERLVVDSVTFTYPTGSEPALCDVSLDIKRGEVVALVGENGSGKTTLAKLLCGLYLPQKGQILWDGRDVATMDPTELRRSIAIIFQDFVQYVLAAADNVGVGREDRFGDRAGIQQAAVQAGAHPFLSALPDGYDTLLGPEFEGGKALSVGQWQRVALARAFFRDAAFIILDEPTAALDARSEHELFQSIRALCQRRSVLLISHRFSTVRSADRIYVLKDGAIVESGNHSELMRRGGLYSELFTLQASAYLPDEVQTRPLASTR
jgi:ATP-binding cassette subfamily B protein